jgi:hypothetical protein
MQVITRLKHMRRMEPLIVLDASLELVIGRRLIPVHYLKMEKW